MQLAPRGPRHPLRRLSAALAVLAIVLAAPATASAGKVQTLVYFVKGNQMQAVPRTIWYGSGGVERAAKLTVRKIRYGPTKGEQKRGIYSAFDVPLTVVDVKITKGVGYVYAPKGIFAASPSLRLKAIPAGRLRLAQIVYTLTEFPNVKSVTVVTTNPEGKGVRYKNLKRRTFSLPTGKPPKVTLPPWKGPRPGNVKSVKEALAELRFLPGDAVDANADYRLQQVLYAFQAWYGLDRSGIVDTATIKKLRALGAIDASVRPAVRGSGKHAEVHRDKGVALMVEDGEVVRAVHISSGAGGATPSGSFTVFRKETMSWSVPFSVWMPYASYFTGGIAFHSYPDVPPWPASHGCIRTSAPEAPFVYDFLDYGTPVYVY